MSSAQLIADYRLTEKQAAFAQAIARGVPQTEAARLAGYTGGENSVIPQASRMMRHPRIQAAVRAEVGRLLVMEGAPLALRTLIDILKDEGASIRVRADAGKILLDRAGYAPRAQETGAGEGEKQLSEMSPAELRAFIERHEKEIDRLEQERAERARDVSPGAVGAPLLARQPDQDLDFLE